MKHSIIRPLAALIAVAGIASAQDPKPQPDPNNYKPEEVVKKFDKNNDSKLDLAEYSAMKKFSKATDPAAAAKKAFEELDVNKDGSVTAEELKVAHVAKMKPKDAKAPEAKPDAKAKPGAKPEAPAPAPAAAPTAAPAK